MVVQIEREHAHEARQRLDARHDEGRGREHDLALAQPVAVDFGFGEVGDQVVGRLGAPCRDFRGEKVAEFLEGGDVLGRAALHALVGRHREDDLAPDLAVVALGQTHGAEQQADGDLAGIVIDEFEILGLANPVERAVGDLDRRRDHAVEILAQEGGLAQRTQTIMPRRIGGAKRRAGAAWKLIDHVALRRGKRLPVARGLDDVVVARKNPYLRVFAPVTGVLLAQHGVIGERVRVDGR